MHCLNQNALWLLPLALVAGALALLAWKRSGQVATAWGSTRLRQRYHSPLAGKRYAVKGVALMVAFACGILAIARPSIPNVTTDFPAGTADVVVLLDVSISMAAKDCNGKSRAGAAREILRERVLPALNNNRVGVISYAGKAVPTVFLTYNQETLHWLAENELKIASAPGQGSALGDAFNLAFRYFDKDSDGVDESGKQRKHKKYIVLLSDGGTDDKTRYDELVAGARQRNIQLIVIGLGQQTPALIPTEELPYQERLKGEYYQEGGERAKTAIDERLLTQLAQAVDGGVYVHANGPADVNFPRLVSNMETRQRVSERELFQWATLACLVALVVAATSTDSLRRRD